ncbi:hypothetical protein HYH03_009580 [Edaphochlamys debaryana]|uniref:Uncharacterized protein n=1 Tax=Edaphochlamys debaryana TaxID=47281 RepID=A0A836BYB9_9CHLO|nr:hypothetical protein HYH03_009580 [Edaphochlamys debaryana]|eukprot:KAG2492084.1 hypothetical protein HYH03_009580 [Edaphochlamys debaryana]
MSEEPIDNEALAEEAVDAGPQDDQEIDEAQIDAETSALLKELEEQQEEVQRMLATQREQAAELGGMKDSLADELHQLQDDAWKLQVFAELEMLKRQLAAINNLDADLDAMEAKLEEGGDEAVDDDFEKELAAARAGTLNLLNRLSDTTAAVSALGEAAEAGDAVAVATTSSAASASAKGAAAEGEAAGEAEGEGVEDVAALQDELDAELSAMYKQLQAIKAESAMVAARKAQLELELMALIREGADELTAQLETLDVEDGEEPKDQAESESAGTPGKEAAKGVEKAEAAAAEPATA